MSVTPTSGGGGGIYMRGRTGGIIKSTSTEPKGLCGTMRTMQCTIYDGAAGAVSADNLRRPLRRRIHDNAL